MIPLPVPQLNTTLNKLHDLVETHVDVVLKPNNLYQRSEQYGLDLLQEKIQLILSLAKKEGFVASHLAYHEANDFKAGLDKMSIRRERRSVAAMAAAVMGVASFGASIFNQAQIRTLNEA